MTSFNVFGGPPAVFNTPTSFGPGATTTRRRRTTSRPDAPTTPETPEIGPSPFVPGGVGGGSFLPDVFGFNTRTQVPEEEEPSIEWIPGRPTPVTHNGNRARHGDR